MLYAPQSGGVRSYLEAKRRWLLARTKHRHTLGVDVARFTPEGDPGMKRRLGLDEDTRLLVFVGRYAREKNIPRLAEAMATFPRWCAGGRTRWSACSSSASP